MRWDRIQFQPLVDIKNIPLNQWYVYFLIIGVSFALKIETETGYYECQNAIINMFQNTVKYILQCTLELQDIWNVQNVMRKVGKEKF